MKNTPVLTIETEEQLHTYTWTFQTDSIREVLKKAEAVQALYDTPDDNTFVNVVYPSGDIYCGSLCYFPYDFVTKSRPAEVRITIFLPRPADD